MRLTRPSSGESPQVLRGGSAISNVGEAIITIRTDSAEALKTLDGFGDRIRGRLGDAGAAAGRALQSALEPIAVATGAFIGTSLVKGFGRFTTIENSLAGLKVSLGSASEATQFLQGVLDTVKGTPFNLDQFAKAGQTLVAMGVDATKAIGKTGLLGAIGEVVASTGGGAQEVDRLVQSFGKVAAGGRVTGETLNELSSQGVNALKILANSFGVTEEEMRKLVSAGKVGREGIDILVDGIIKGSEGINGSTAALGGSMERMRETTTGAISGILAAMSRVGAAFFQGLTGVDGMGEGSNRLAKVLNSLEGIIDSLGDRFRSFGAVVGDALGVVSHHLERLPTVFSNISDKGEGLRKIIAPLGAAFAALGLKGVAGALGPLGKLIPVIGPIPAALIAMVAGSKELQGILMELFTAISPVVQALGNALVPVLGALMPLVETLATTLGGALVSAISTLAPVLVTLVQVLTPLIVKVAEFAALLLEKLQPVLGPILTAILGLLAIQSVIGPLQAFAGILGTVATAAKALWLVLMANPFILVAAGVVALAVLIVTNWDAIKNAIGTAWDWVQEKTTGWGDAMQTILTTVLRVILGIITGGLSEVVIAVLQNWDNIRNKTSEVWNAITGAISGAWNAIKSAVFGAVADVAISINNAWNNARNATVNAWNNLASAVSSGIERVLGFVRGIPGRVTGALGNMGSLLTGIGRSIMDGLLNGIIAAWNRVANYLSGLAAKIKSLKGPIEKDRKMLIPEGQAIMDSLMAGFSSRQGELAKTLGAVTRQIQNGVGLGNLNVTGTAINQRSLSTPTVQATAPVYEVSVNLPDRAMKLSLDSADPMSLKRFIEQLAELLATREASFG